MKNVHQEFGEINEFDEIIAGLNQNLIFQHERTKPEISAELPNDYDLSLTLFKLRTLGIEFSYDSQRGKPDVVTFKGDYSLGLLSDMGLNFPNFHNYGSDVLSKNEQSR